MTLSDIIKLQIEFDQGHQTNFNWAELISKDNIQQLEFLTIALTGEIGKFANCLKKILRGDCIYDEMQDHISR